MRNNEMKCNEMVAKKELTKMEKSQNCYQFRPFSILVSQTMVSRASFLELQKPRFFAPEWLIFSFECVLHTRVLRLVLVDWRWGARHAEARC